VKEALGARSCLDREVGPSCVSYEERVAGEHEPGLRPTRAVDDCEAAVLRPVTGGVDAPEHDLAERDLGPVF
jgi:hypothetical protein